jgi:hypothetical protein
MANMGCLCAASRGIWIQSGQWSPGAGRSALRRAFWPPQGRPTDDDSLGRSILDAEGEISGRLENKNYY